jgi:tRNA dimethylallyltransferase
MQPVLLILGPTASGKTARAIAEAKAYGGEVVNMDSMQVYADLSVLTARPTPDEMGEVPHHLFGHVDAGHAYSTGEWAREAMEAIRAIEGRGRRPILAGGTGLYAHALTEGLVETPPVPADVRAATRKAVGADPRAAHARLKLHDPEAASRIEPKDAVRIARALEVWDATGRSLSDWHRTPQPPALAAGTWEGLALLPDRETLYARIATRCETMMESGALEEGWALYQRHLPRDLPAMKAHGMPHLCDFFEERIDFADLLSRTILDTRHYAKRQMTWIRNRAAGWTVV